MPQDRDYSKKLRQEAENIACQRDEKNININLEEAYHELSVHQIELEMQNRQLRDTEQKLRELLSKYDRLYHHAPIGYVTLDQKGVITELNETFALLCGKPASQLRHTYLSTLLTPDSASVFRQRMAAFFNHPEGKILPVTFMVSGKGEIDLEIRAERVTDDQLLSCNLVDVTSQHKLQSKLQTEEKRYRNLYEKLPVPYQSFDSYGYFIEVNPAWLSTLGYFRNEVIGHKVVSFLHPESENVFEDILFQLKSSGGVQRVELKIRHKDGHYLDALFEAQTEVDQQGKFQRTYCIFQDITQRKQTERKYSTLVAEANIGIALADAETGELTECNQTLAAMVERTREELLGQPQAILHPKDELRNDGLTSSFINQRESLSSLPKQQKLLTKSGKLLDVEIRAKSIEYDGRSMMLGIFQDITERKRAEAERSKLESQLNQKHKMEAVGYMAGGMAHNFNNNLSIILGNLELSKIRLTDDSKVAPLLKNAITAVLRSRDLVLKIITYSRQGIQNKVPMQLRHIIDETIALLSSTYPATINLQKIIDPECGSEFILADASQVQEVIINLCNNAMHAMNEKGDITIALEPVELCDQDIPVQYDAGAGYYAKLSVQDTGCGMAAEMVDKIFDLFYTTKEEYQGAGMGLSTVQGIVAQHGGAIKVNSVPDQGTIFSIYFPIIDKAVTEIPVNTEDLPGGTEKILFIDDNEMLATLGEQILSDAGYQVTVMTESPEAVKLFTANSEHFDLVVTDQTMPELSGQELIQELKQIKPDIRTILCTGYSSQINEVESQQQGIDAFCMKPLDLSKLLQTVRDVLDKKRE